MDAPAAKNRQVVRRFSVLAGVFWGVAQTCLVGCSSGAELSESELEQANGKGGWVAPELSFDETRPTLRNANVTFYSFGEDPNVAALTSFVDGADFRGYIHERVSEYKAGPLARVNHVAMAMEPIATEQGIRDVLADTSKFPGGLDRLHVFVYPTDESMARDVDGQEGYLCYHFGGFRNHFRRSDGSQVVYVVVGQCAGGMFFYPGWAAYGLSGFDVTSMVASHELIEAMTSPLFREARAIWGLNAAHYGRRVAFTGIDVGDQCKADLSPASNRYAWVGGHAVARTWSNLCAAAWEDPCQPTNESYFNTYLSVSHKRLRVHDPELGEQRIWGTRIEAGRRRTVKVDFFSSDPSLEWTALPEQLPWRLRPGDSQFMPLSAEDRLGMFAHSLFGRDGTKRGIEISVPGDAVPGTLLFFSVTSQRGTTEHVSVGVVEVTQPKVPCSDQPAEEAGEDAEN